MADQTPAFPNVRRRGRPRIGLSLLIVFQFPFADIRRFIGGDHYRLAIPAFPFGQPGRDFIRSTGQIKSRRRGTPRVWPEDGTYCDAKSAIRLLGISGQGHGQQHSLPDTWWLDSVRCAFRRYYFDGCCNARIEVGLASTFELFPWSDQFWWTNATTRRVSAARFVQTLLDIPVRVPHIVERTTTDGKSDKRRQDVQTRLADAGRPLGKHLLAATTSILPQAIATQDWWISPGRPLILVEYDASLKPDLPPGRPVRQLEDDGIFLHHSRVEHGATSVGAWFVGLDQDRDRAKLRELRLHLLRLHAELQSMMGVLRAARAGKLPTEPGTEAFDELQRFLNHALRLLQSRSRHALPQSALLDAALDAVDAMPEAETALLMHELSGARRQVLAKVEAYNELTRNRQTISVFTGGGPMIHEGDLTKHYSIDVGGDFTGVIGEQNTVQDSLNRVEQAVGPDELKDALKELTFAAAALYQNAPDELRDSVESVPRDVATFRDEALAQEPRRAILEAVGEGLRKTAEVVGDLGKPVIQLVATISRMIG